jgi:hypothetical protein
MLVDPHESVKLANVSFTGNGTYTFTALGISDFKKPITLYDSTNKQTYTRVSSDTFVQSVGNGNAIYTVVGDSIRISSSVGSTTLVFMYYSTYDAKTSGGTLQKGLSSGTDLPLIAPRFHDYYVEDVSMVLFRKQRKYDDYKLSRADRQEIINEIFDEYVSREDQVEELIGSYDNAENYD